VDASSLTGFVQYRDWQNQKLTMAGRIEIGQMPILVENKDGF
jgi:hypothetical protein